MRELDENLFFMLFKKNIKSQAKLSEKYSLRNKTSLFITINVEEFISNLEKYKVRPEP